MLKLKRFRVTEFRSVKDSGWIDTDAVTALIGTNESGKTNLLVPLWKLKPAKGGAIDPIADYPRAAYNRMRKAETDQIFIHAEFECDDELRDWLATTTGQARERFERVRVFRYYDGDYTISFPDAQPIRTAAKTTIADLVAQALGAIEAEKTIKKEQAVQTSMVATLAGFKSEIDGGKDELGVERLKELLDGMEAVSLTDVAQHSPNAARWAGLSSEIRKQIDALSHVAPEKIDGVFDKVIASIPHFVYYSNYGNLDSEIYLPHVIANAKRKDLGPKEEGKARTLRVLFEFVKLGPEEILSLGKAATGAEPTAAPTQKDIDAAAARTKERDILLRSADTDLTKSFRAWWKQGDYRFRFSADGDHFRIWVSDDRRPEDIELESRSTGLQWFFSFFLVFLVERRDAHKGAVLLLDEPGLSLHPLSQRDLSGFFEGLSKDNPIIYTTHSPFLVDQDHVDRVRVVYVDDDGATAVSSDLRANTANDAETKSVYAVHAALGLSVSDALLQGCTSVIVEGSSDQYYLTGIKTVLIARKKITPRRELLFVPAGGAKGVNTIVPIVSAKDELPPIVLLDDDRQGRQFADALRDGPIYKGAKTRVLNVREFVKLEYAEIEDLLAPYVVEAASRAVRGPDDDFRDVYKSGTAIVPQIEAYAAKHGVKLDHGWKVDLARQVKQRLLKDIDKVSDDNLKLWAELFGRFEPPKT